MKISRIVAIDPDVTKSGVAEIDTGNRNVTVKAMTFPELIDHINGIESKESVRIAVEAGWLNKPNWHFAKSIAIAGSIGNDVGRNHETGRKIVEMCEHVGFSVSLVRPLKKQGTGAGGKVTHSEIQNILRQLRMSLAKKRTNQDERDSILIAIHEYNRL